MAATLEALAEEALALSVADRAELIERLLASLGADPENDDAWLAEAKRRDAEIESGKVTAVSGAEAVARLRAKFR